MYGYGNSMFLATHGILARTASGGGVDPDAQAFITAASITDPTQQSAINQLVVDLKGYNIWTKMKAIYPFVGGTAAQHKWNLKDPRDLDVAFRLVFNGGWTHSANGALPNGTNAFANTYLAPSTNQSLTSGHISLYSRTSIASTSQYGGSGLRDAPTVKSSQLIPRRGIDNLRAGVMWDEGTGGIVSGGTETDARGYYLISRTANNSLKLYKNSSIIGTNSSTQTASSLSFNTYFLGAVSENGAVSGTFDNKQLAFASIGSGLTDTEAANFYTAVQAFQVSLGRSIGTQTVSDADAQAFVTNAGIVDQVEANAVNNLVIGLKADGLWTSARAIYPFVGGTSTTHKWNLRNPLDTNAAFRLTFGGGITHSSSGIKGNSLNGYYETYLNPSTEFSLATGGCGFVAINENLDTNTDFGAFTSGVNYRFQLWIKAGNTTYASMLSDSLYTASNTASTIGFYGVTRQPNDNTNFYYIKDSTNTATAAAYQEPNSTINGFALNINNALRQSWGERRQSFAYYGEGLTTAQAQLLRTRVNTFNTTLGR